MLGAFITSVPATATDADRLSASFDDFVARHRVALRSLVSAKRPDYVRSVSGP